MMNTKSSQRELSKDALFPIITTQYVTGLGEEKKNFLTATNVFLRALSL